MTLDEKKELAKILLEQWYQECDLFPSEEELNHALRNVNDVEQPEAETFIDGLIGFMKWATHNEVHKSSTVLSNILHDINEYNENRNEDWFSPRTYRYIHHLNDQVAEGWEVA